MKRHPERISTTTERAELRVSPLAVRRLDGLFLLLVIGAILLVASQHIQNMSEDLHPSGRDNTKRFLAFRHLLVATVAAAAGALLAAWALALGMGTAYQ